MKEIKWIGPFQVWDVGSMIPGTIYTETQVPVDVMSQWVSQGFAEWYEEPAKKGKVKNPKEE